MLAAVNNLSDCWVCTEFPTLWTRHAGTGCKAGRLLTSLQTDEWQGVFPWERAGSLYQAIVQVPSLEQCWVGRGGAGRAECQHSRQKYDSPYPYVLNAEVGLQMKLQLVGWWPATLCKNVTATDYWWRFLLLGVFDFCTALWVLAYSLYSICRIWKQRASMITTQVPCQKI